MTARDLVTDVLLEHNIVAAGGAPSAEDAAYVLGKLNRILNNWNADHEAAYVDVFQSFQLSANVQPHTIGPAGMFNAAQRPVSIDGANLLLTTNLAPAATDVRVPITLRDRAWWLATSMQRLASPIVTDLYYEPDWPNGKLFLWPVPTIAYVLELSFRYVLTAFATLDDVVTLPPGYQDALTLTGAEAIAAHYAKDISAQLAKDAAKARARIFANNVSTPRLATQDAVMPGGRGGSFNYRNGRVG